MSRDNNDPTAHSTAFLLVSVGFVVALLVSNIVSVKLAQIGPWVMPAGVIVFPISYIVGDILTEVYGYRRTRQVIWLGFGANLAMVGFIAAAVALPAAPFWPHQAAYEQILGFAPRLLAASFVAYLVGEFANAYVLARLKLLTAGRWLWLRTIGSTLVGQGLDSAVFMVVAFAGILSGTELAAAGRHPVAGEVGIRSSGDAADLLDRRRLEADRGCRRLRPNGRFQSIPAAMSGPAPAGRWRMFAACVSW